MFPKPDVVGSIPTGREILKVWAAGTKPCVQLYLRLGSSTKRGALSLARFF